MNEYGEVDPIANGEPDIAQLLRVIARLRDPERGCPWDVKQNFSSIAAYTIEEAYEVADAIARNDLAELKDELGDLLLQVVFHSRMAEEQGAFAFADVVAAICNKMIRRHPYVFPVDGHAMDTDFRLGMAGDAEAQLQLWEAGKRQERETSGDASALAGITRGLPEWLRALKLQKRAASVGFDWPGPEPVMAKLHEEIEELRAEFTAATATPDDAEARARLEDEIGDVLFVCVNLARHAKVDVGSALRRANLKFERRFRGMEALAQQEGISLAALNLAQQDALWDRVKQGERSADAMKSAGVGE